jgi:glycosyltransferase involved in cell wall biosynthesis
VNEELAKRLVRNGHEVMILTSAFDGADTTEMIDGYKVIRIGNKWTVYYKAYTYYKKHLIGWADIVIDEINTVPFFAKFYVRENNILFIHQLCREIWFYQMIFPLDIFGYILEPLYLRTLSDSRVMTVSASTKKDLIRNGFREDKIRIISEGIDIAPVHDLDMINKYEKPTILSFGSLRAMKRTHHIIRAFAIAKRTNPNMQLIIAGDYESPFGKKIVRLAKQSKYYSSISFLGRVDADKKIELLQKSHILLATSAKEGWGLTITEAASQGTPAIVYDVDGLRDSVRHNETGIISQDGNPQAMAESIVSLFDDKAKYDRMRRSAWRWSKEITFEKSINDFLDIISN